MTVVKYLIFLSNTQVKYKHRIELKKDVSA